MANIVGLKVECAKHTLPWKNNKGKMDQKPFYVDRSFARQYLFKADDPICQKCGYKCQSK